MKLQFRRIGGAAALALALVLTPAMAQHDQGGHGAGKGEHKGNGTQAAGELLPSCPVSGEPVNLAVSVATDDGPVFFCCDHCVKKFQANPGKYADEVSAQRQAFSDRPKIQVTCPVSGDPVDSKVFTEFKGGKVFFCCKGCIPKFEGNAAKYQSALANGYTYQTKCPVMGNDINPKAFTTLASGHKVYFCCPRCENKLFSKPSEYLPKLKSQGYDFKPEEMTHADAEGQKQKSHDRNSDDHGGHDGDH